MYLPKTNCPALFCLVRWYVLCTAEVDAAMMPINGSSSSIYIFCILQERTRFPITTCILSMIFFAYGFPKEAYLVLIVYYCSIKIVSNLLPRDSPPWLYVIFTCHGYRSSHIVSTKLAIINAFLSLYYVVLNHPNTGLSM